MKTKLSLIYGSIAVMCLLYSCKNSTRPTYSDSETASVVQKKTSTSTTSKVYSPDIEMKNFNNNIHTPNMRVAYYQGKLFSGEVWSPDERTCFLVENGMPKKFIYYHSNGQIGALGEKVNGKRYFDINGCPMEEQAFMQKYGKELKEEASMQIEF